MMLNLECALKGTTTDILRESYDCKNTNFLHVHVPWSGDTPHQPAAQ